MKSNSDKDARVFPLWCTWYYLIIISPHSELNDFCKEAKESRTRETAETRNLCNLHGLTVMSKCDIIISPSTRWSEFLGFLLVFLFNINLTFMWSWRCDHHLPSSAFWMFFFFPVLSCSLITSLSLITLTCLTCVQSLLQGLLKLSPPPSPWKHSACSTRLSLGVLGELGLCKNTDPVGFTLNWVCDEASDLVPALGLDC